MEILPLGFFLTRTHRAYLLMYKFYSCGVSTRYKCLKTHVYLPITYRLSEQVQGASITPETCVAITPESCMTIAPITQKKICAGITAIRPITRKFFSRNDLTRIFFELCVIIAEIDFIRAITLKFMK